MKKNLEKLRVSDKHTEVVAAPRRRPFLPTLLGVALCAPALMVSAAADAAPDAEASGAATASATKSTWKLKKLKKGELKANWDRRQARLQEGREKAAADIKARAEKRKEKWKNATVEQKAAWKAKRAARLAAAGKAAPAGSGAAVQAVAPAAPKGRHVRAKLRAKRKGAELSKVE